MLRADVVVAAKLADLLAAEYVYLRAGRSQRNPQGEDQRLYCVGPLRIA